MSRIGLLLPFLLLAGPAAAAPEGGPAAAACDDQHRACQSGCALDWGASVRTRDRLGRCLAQCERVSAQCLDRAFGRARGEDVKPVEQPRHVQPRKAPSRYVDRAPAQRTGGGSTPNKGPAPPMNVGAPDWLDEEPSKPARAAAPARTQTPAPAEAAAGATKAGDWSTSAPAPQPAAAAAPLPRAEAETLTPLPAAHDDGDSFEPDPLLPRDFEPAPARGSAAETLPVLEPLPPLEPLPAQADQAPAAREERGGSLWPSKSGRAAPAPAARPAAPSKPKGPSFKKKDDISEWDPD